MLKIISNASAQIGKTAIVSNGKNYTYDELLNASHQFAALLLHKQQDLNETRVAFMVNPGFDYVKVQWAIWRAGGLVVPLCLTHPLPSLEYVLEDTEASILVVSAQYESFIHPLADKFNLRLIVLEKVEAVAI